MHSAVVQVPFDKVFSLAVLGRADKELVCVSGKGAGCDCQSSGSHQLSDFSLRGNQKLFVFQSDILVRVKYLTLAPRLPGLNFTVEDVNMNDG